MKWARFGLSVVGPGWLLAALAWAGIFLPHAIPVHAGDPAVPARPPPLAVPDLDALMTAFDPLMVDPAFGPLHAPEGQALREWILSELPQGLREPFASSLADLRARAVIAPTVPGDVRSRILRFVRPDDAASFVAARRAGSEELDAREALGPDSVHVIKATYEKGAGPGGRLPGYVAHRTYQLRGFVHSVLAQVAQLGAIVAEVEVSDLPDIGRLETDAALVRVEAALSDPEGVRRAGLADPVLLRSLGPTTMIRAVGADGSEVHRFAFRVQWEESAGSYRGDAGHAKNGIGLTRVPPGPAALHVWGARSEKGTSLPWGPGSAELKGDSRDVEVVLPRGLELTGSVRGRDGMAVEGIEVLAFPTDGCLGSPAGLLPPDGLGVASSFDAHSRDRSGPSGSFLLRGLGQSRYRITVAHDGEWFPVHGLEADAGTEETLSLVIERAVSVDVTVLGPDARPVVGAEVSAWPLREGGGYSGGWTSSLAFETDQEGVAHMRRLRPGGKYRLSVSPPRDARHLARKHISDWTPRATTVHLRP